MKNNLNALRSLLYVPGNSEKMILKARESAADALILDLEDAVAVEHKLEARALVVRALREMTFDGKEVYVRINPLTTDFGLEDARAAAAAGAPGILLPKAERVDDVTTLAPILQSRNWAGAQTVHDAKHLLLLIETPRGVFAARELAEASELVAGLLFGSADLSREVGCTLSEDEAEVFYARSHVLLAARAAGVAAYDSPHFGITDLEGLRQRCQAARRLGYDGKTAIHPAHLEVVNEAFTPTEAEFANAERIVNALAAAPGRGAIVLDGQMIDQVHLATAKKILAQRG
jgi:citrate lyase beta subunit